jgi:phage portal protein BeeE
MNLLGFSITRNQKSKIEKQKSFSVSPQDWLAGRDPERGPVLNNAYQQVVWVYRAINALAEQVANVPFLFSSGERGRENLITSGPLVDFYNRPHPQINRFEYWELRIIWLMLRGECFRVPIYEDSSSSSSSSSSSLAGLPLSAEGASAHASRITHHGPQRRKLSRVLILDPAHFHHIIDNHQLVGWRYTGFGPGAPLESQVFLPEEVWFEKLPNPFDFWRGMSPLYAAATAARADFAASSFMRGIIENNGDTGLIVRTEKPVDPEQEEQIRARLRDHKRCAGFADKPVFLSGVSEIIKPALSSSDLQFLENRKFSRSEICAAFGVPEEILTATDNAKYDVMQGARLNFIENRVAPLCRRLEAEEDRVVHALQPGAVGWFDLDSLPISQQAQRNRLATAKLGFDMGIPFNQLNRVMDLGFKQLPWGDNGYLPANLQNLGTAPDKPRAASVLRDPIARAAEFLRGKKMEAKK